jgi:hypothetical protein
LASKDVSERTSYRVEFEPCGHKAWILAEEYGDGSAWCQQCDEFQTYNVRLAERQNPDPNSQEPTA